MQFHYCAKGLERVQEVRLNSTMIEVDVTVDGLLHFVEQFFVSHFFSSWHEQSHEALF
jgi:hypothetical protein